jgi:hypothetical protein
MSWNPQIPLGGLPGASCPIVAASAGDALAASDSAASEAASAKRLSNAFSP